MKQGGRNEKTWETQEVINWLINDEGTYYTLLGEHATSIWRYVTQGYAPQGLYDSFKAEKGSFGAVDWDTVEEALHE